MQEVTHKLCDTLSMVANVGVTHPEYVMVVSDSTGSGSGEDKALENSTDEVTKEDTPVTTSTNKEGDNGEPGAGEEVNVEQSLDESGGKTEGEVVEGEDEKKEGQANSVGKRGMDQNVVTSSVSEELLQPTLQALAVLSNVSTILVHFKLDSADLVSLQVLAHFIDCVFGGSEKDKVTSLLKSVLFNIWPHLHNHRYNYPNIVNPLSRSLH